MSMQKGLNMPNETVELEEVNDLLVCDDTNALEYPCIIISGITTENEYLFFSQRKVPEECACLKMYFECEGEMVELGLFPLTLDFLLSLRSIGDYGIQLCYDETRSKFIDLNDATTLTKFIKL